MNDFVLKRINNQINRFKKEDAVFTNAVRVEEKKTLTIPLDENILRRLLMDNIEDDETKLQVSQDVPVELEIFTFEGIEHFCSWYEPLAASFTEAQRIAITTLVDTKNMINNGCGCKRKQRFGQAEGYYTTFWTENRETDLPLAVRSVVGAKKIEFKTEGNIIYAI